MPVKNVKCGEGTKIWHPELVNLYDCILGENCTVGCFVEIGPGVIIGNNCRIQSKVYIPSGVVIGNNVFLGPGVTFLNDKYPPSKGDWQKYQTVIGDNVVIGGGALILPDVSIYTGAFIGAGAVVTKNVPAHTKVLGFPARVYGDYK